MLDCPICKGSLECYDREDISAADAVEIGDIMTLRIYCWCPACKKNYLFQADYELKASYGLSER